jgi:hypothetical protein
LDGEGEVTIPIGINFFWPDAWNSPTS